MKLAVVLGSTRPNRQSLKFAQWINKTALENTDIESKIVDLVDFPLPLFDEAISPRYNPNREVSLDVQKWLEVIKNFDAYIFVTPEYNHSIPAVLKNALDYLTWELKHKPVTVASHGSVGGARAALHLKEILSESQAAVIPNNLAVVGMSDIIDQEGVLDASAKANPYGPQAQLDRMIGELKWYSDALVAARALE